MASNLLFIKFILQVYTKVVLLLLHNNAESTLKRMYFRNIMPLKTLDFTQNIINWFLVCSCH